MFTSLKEWVKEYIRFLYANKDKIIKYKEINKTKMMFFTSSGNKFIVLFNCDKLNNIKSVEYIFLPDNMKSIKLLLKYWDILVKTRVKIIFYDPKRFEKTMIISPFLIDRLVIYDDLKMLLVKMKKSITS